MIVDFVIPGPPVPKARPRRVWDERQRRMRTHTDQRTIDYEAHARFHARCARPLSWPLDGRYEVCVDFHLPSRRRVDGDNLLKSILDSANGVLWADDSQVDVFHVTKDVDRERPRAVVRVAVIQESAA